MIPGYVEILRHDLMSFIERSFYELNPQTELLGAPHLDLIAEPPANWWTPLLSSEEERKVSNGPGTSSIYR